MDNKTENEEIENIDNRKCVVPIWEKQNLTVNEAVAYSNIGENTLRNLIDEPNCPFVIFIGNRRLIKRKMFNQWIEKRTIIKK